MTYVLTAANLAGRQVDSYATLPALLDALVLLGLSGSADAVRTALALSGEWRGMATVKGQSVTVSVRRS